MNRVAIELRASLRLLGSRRFGAFWWASLLSNIGTWAQLVAEPWLLLKLGASPFLLGLDSFAMNAPVLVLTLAGGLLADRRDKRWVIAVFQSIQMLCPTLIFFLLLAGKVPIWAVIAASLVVGITDALSMPAFSSVVPSIVAREDIPRGLALNSTQFNLSRILGPALGGVLMTSLGAVACFGASALSFLPVIALALWVVPRRSREHAPALPSAHSFAGLHQIARAPVLRGAVLTVLVSSVFCGPLVTFVPVLVANAFHGSATSFSVAVSAFGIGGVAGASALLVLPAAADRRFWSAGAGIVYGIAVIVAGCVPWLGAIPVVMVFAGASMTIANTSANTLLQSAAEPRLLGQAAALYMLALRGGLSLGSLFAGAAVERLGVRPALVLNGALAIVALVIVARRWTRRERAKGS